MRTLPIALAALPVALAPPVAPVAAQAVTGPSVSVGVTSDHRRRGLSWSDGKPAIEASVHLPLGDHVAVEAAAMTPRDSLRNGRPDAAIDLAARFGDDVGPVRLGGGVIGHLFPGATLPGYVEVETSAGLAIGPARFDLFLTYAPTQAAIGGDNLHVGADASAALPGSAFSFVAGIGRSSGSVDRADRAARLRPDGAYVDYRLGIDHVRGPLTLGLRYSDTTIGERRLPRRDRHAGARVIVQAALDF